jgi:hypothetical protein
VADLDEQNQPSCLNVISDLLKRCETDDTVFPPTDLYNEGWLLQIIVDWFSKHDTADHELSFSDGCKCFSEARLPTQFKATSRKDPLYETWTHADGVIGHIVVGGVGKTDTSLATDATHLVVTEAKMFSKLSAGVKNASYFNQAARYAACIAELLTRADQIPENFERLGLYVLAPAETIGYGWFKKPMEKDDIRQRVERRVKPYECEKDQWFENWFLPALGKMEIGCLSWESVLEYVGSVVSDYSIGLQNFYQKCLAFNHSVSKTAQK